MGVVTQKIPVEMQKDERPIKSITTHGDGGVCWCVGYGDMTRIIAYEENSQMALAWFAVYTGTWLASRINAAAVEQVWYGRGRPQAK